MMARSSEAGGTEIISVPSRALPVLAPAGREEGGLLGCVDEAERADGHGLLTHSMRP